MPGLALLRPLDAHLFCRIVVAMKARLEEGFGSAVGRYNYLVYYLHSHLGFVDNGFWERQ